MKNSFVALVTLALFSIAMIGCGEDTPTVNVNESLKFKTGDKFTYNYYDRDSSNARVDTSKKVYVWTVLRTDLNIFDNSVVTEVQQITYTSDGTTPIDTALLYFSAKELGTLQQYDLIKATIQRLNIAEIQPIVDQIDETWIQISDTKSPSALSWGYPSNLVNTVKLGIVPLIDTVQSTMDVNSSHQGRKETTVVAGTYAQSFKTDHQVLLRVDVKTGTLKDIAPTPINDSVALHYAVDINGGILFHSMDSKQITVTGLGKYNVVGFEMELTSVTRASTN